MHLGLVATKVGPAIAHMVPGSFPLPALWCFILHTPFYNYVIICGTSIIHADIVVQKSTWFGLQMQCLVCQHEGMLLQQMLMNLLLSAVLVPMLTPKRQSRSLAATRISG